MQREHMVPLAPKRVEFTLISDGRTMHPRITGPTTALNAIRIHHKTTDQDVQTMLARLFDARFHLVSGSSACGWVVRTIIVLTSSRAPGKRSSRSAANDASGTKVLSGR